jgi:hypothetical protein
MVGNDATETTRGPVRVLHWARPLVTIALIMVLVSASADAVSPNTGRTKARAVRTPGRPMRADDRADRPRIPVSRPDRPPVAADGPRLLFLETTGDLGVLYQGEKGVHDFVFRNAGRSTLTISEVRASCSSCTVAELARRRYAPEETGTIHVELGTSAYHGRVEKTITVASNDPRQPQINLVVAAQVKLEAKFSAAGLYVGKCKAGESQTAEITLMGVDVRRFQVVGTTSSDPGVRVTKISNVSQDSKCDIYRLTIQVGPFTGARRVIARVTVQTDLPHTRELAFTIYGRAVE